MPDALPLTKSSVRKPLFAIIALILTSCAGTRNVPFSEERFHVSPLTGYVQNSDSTLRFTFGHNNIEPDLLLIDNDSTALTYNNLTNYLNGICRQLEAECDNILFYAPTQRMLVVRITEKTPWKPRSETTNMTDEYPYTSWIRNDDSNNYERKPTRLYSNILLNKRKKHILIIDRFTYGNQSLAMIHIIQSSTKQFLKIGLPQWTETWVDVTDPTCLEPIANWIDGHRKMAIENYRLGLYGKIR